MDSATWYAYVRVRIPNAMEHDEPDAEKCLRQAIDDDGGIIQVIIGWCDPDDLKLIRLSPVLLCERGCGNEWDFGCNFCGDPVCEECGSVPEGICNRCAEKEA